MTKEKGQHDQQNIIGSQMESMPEKLMRLNIPGLSLILPVMCIFCLSFYNT